MENSKGSSLKEAEEDKCSKIICYNCSTDGLLQNDQRALTTGWHDIYIYIISKKERTIEETKQKQSCSIW